VNAELARERMVAEQLAARGIHDPRVLAAMRLLPRERFVPPELHLRAYADAPLPIGEGQTISQPYIVALMSQALELPAAGARVLEIGTGSGYQAAVLATMGAAEVISLERIPALAARARATLADMGLAERVRVEVADGTLGWPACAPYDGILVTAAGPTIPRPLLGQLAPGAALVLPMGEEELQMLVRLRQRPEGLAEEYLGGCRFVRLVGRHGWNEA
jgi:protein-L-isoaspartate(D-aspartate) O-methyltransferase